MGYQGEESDSLARAPRLTLLRRKQKLHPAKHWLDGLPDHDLETIDTEVDAAVSVLDPSEAVKVVVFAAVPTRGS